MTIRRPGRSKTGQWQEFIDREQSSVGHLIQDSFAEYCKAKDGSNGNGGNRGRSGSVDGSGSGNLTEDLERLKLKVMASSSARGQTFSTGSLTRTTAAAGATSRSRAAAATSSTTMPRLKSAALSPSTSLSSSSSSSSQQHHQQRRLRDLTARAAEASLRIEEDGDRQHQQHIRRRKSGSESPEKHLLLLPPGIRELETLYAPMKNLSEPLPSARESGFLTTGAMPAPHPIWGAARVSPDDDDARSEACSVVIPPALPPVQSHAVLEESLGHHLPRTPLRTPKFPEWGKTPPVPPRRTNSKLSLDQQNQQQQQPRPKHLSLSGTDSTSSAASSSAGGGAVYANVSKALLNRTSLMSTGSSENSSSDSSIPSCSGEVISCSDNNSSGVRNNSSTAALLPETPSSASEREVKTTFSWPSYSVGEYSAAASAAVPQLSSTLLTHPGSSSSPSPSEEHRSVSQIGEPPDSTAVASSSDAGSSSVAASNLGSSVYARMRRQHQRRAEGDRGEAHYMNALFHTAQERQRQGSYIAMGVVGGGDGGRSRSSGNVKSIILSSGGGGDGGSVECTDAASAIYALPSSRNSLSSLTGRSRQRSSSTSRLQEVTNRARRKLIRPTSSSAASKKARALAEFKELMQEVERKRHFRVGLNIFNSRPSLGLEYLVGRDFLELSPPAVARFLRDCDGLSRDKVGEFLGDLRDPFAMKVLACFMQDLDFSGLRLDKALRLLLAHVRVPGEAQKVERLMEVFGRRYAECNPGFGSRRGGAAPADSAVTLAFAAMLLNTDLHARGVPEERRMTAEDFVRNLRGVDGGTDFDGRLLRSIYRAIRKREFSAGADHVAQARAVERSVQGEGAPQISAEHHRRLVCLCRLYEVTDICKREGEELQHPRDLFLFNDLLVVTKQMTAMTTAKVAAAGCASSAAASAAGGPFYSFRDAFPLSGLEVTLFHTPLYSHGVQLSRRRDPERALLTLNARSEHDRYKFVMDLQESIFEVELMERAMAETMPAEE